VSGSGYPVLPMCFGFLGYDYLAGIVGASLLLSGAIKVLASFCWWSAIQGKKS